MSRALNCLIIIIIFYHSATWSKNNGSKNTSKYPAEDSFYDKLNQSSKADINWHQMFTNLPGDYSDLFKNIFNTKELPGFINVSLLTGSLLALDQTGWNYQRSLYNKVKLDRNVSDAATILGDGRYQLLSSVLFASAGLVFHDKTALKTGSNIAEAVISTGLFVQVLKRITGRESPYASTENGGDWLFMPSIKEYQKNQPKYYSFPSGHLSTATAVVTVIANNYPNIKWIRPIGYSLLGILSLSLVNEGMHWYSDFPLAFFLGYTFGNIIAPSENNMKPSPEGSKAHLFLPPSYGNNRILLSAVIDF